jgi:hypothetical protein
MRYLTKQLSWWRIVLIIGVAAIAIPIAAHVSSTAKTVVKERQGDVRQKLDLQSAAGNEDATDNHSKAKHRKANHSKANHSKASKVAVGLSVALLQDILYDRRSQYWDKRVLRRLESHDEYLDEQTADDNDADAKPNKDSKATKNKDSKADADDEDFADDTDRELERRREYWRKRLDRDW